METLPVPLTPAPLAAVDASRLAAAFLAGRRPTTWRAYRADLSDLAAFLGSPTIDAAASAFVSLPHGTANATALSYKAHLIERGLAAATVNRRLAALRSLVKLGRTVGLNAWTLEVDGLKSQAYRDTRGPGMAGVCLLLAETAGDRPKAVRDRAILRLLFDLGLRRGEVVGLNVGDVDLEGRRLAVLGKGRSEREWLTLPAPTRDAVAAWVRGRGRGGEGEGEADAPLFVRLDRAGKGKGRLTGAAVYHLVRTLGEKIGLRVRPHGIRHQAITRALDLLNGDVRKVQRFSRHRSIETVIRYDDNRTDGAGEVAARLAESA